MAHYFLYDVKLRLLADSRSFLANQKARNAIVGAENLPITSSIAVRIRITKALAHKFVQFSTLIVTIISTGGIFEKMTSFSPILNPDLEQEKLMAVVNSRK